MKKVCISIIFFSLISLSLFAQDLSEKNSDDPSFSFEQQASYSFKIGTQGNTVNTGLACGVSDDLISMLFSAQLNDYTADCTLEMLVFPFSWGEENPGDYNLRKLGIGVKYHREWQYDIGVENDVVLAGAFYFQTPNYFNLLVESGLHAKTTRIYEIQDAKKELPDHSFFLSFTLSKVINSFWTVEGKASTVTTYRYPLCLCPTYRINVMHNISDHLTTGFGFSVTMPDSMGAIPCLSNATLYSFLRYTI